MTDLVPEAVIHIRVSRVQADEDGLLVLICASDATRLRRLERLRHDFVANVSHELRTPITAIKGFVETMLDRRLYRGSNGKRFLRIAGAQAERLDALVEDLLSLSRIEQGEHDGIDATAQPLAPIVTRAVDACRSRLGGRRARIGIAGVDGCGCAPTPLCWSGRWQTCWTTRCSTAATGHPCASARVPGTALEARTALEAKEACAST